MLEELFDTEITIRRRDSTSALAPRGGRDYGDRSTWPIVYDRVKARIEQREKTSPNEYNASGERIDTSTKIYVQSTTHAETQDAVFDGAGNYLGLVAYSFRAFSPGNGTSHYEIDIELK